MNKRRRWKAKARRAERARHVAWLNRFVLSGPMMLAAAYHGLISARPINWMQRFQL